MFACTDSISICLCSVHALIPQHMCRVLIPSDLLQQRGELVPAQITVLDGPLTVQVLEQAEPGGRMRHLRRLAVTISRGGTVALLLRRIALLLLRGIALLLLRGIALLLLRGITLLLLGRSGSLSLESPDRFAFQENWDYRLFNLDTGVNGLILCYVSDLDNRDGNAFIIRTIDSTVLQIPLRAGEETQEQVNSNLTKYITKLRDGGINVDAEHGIGVSILIFSNISIAQTIIALWVLAAFVEDY